MSDVGCRIEIRGKWGNGKRRVEKTDGPGRKGLFHFVIPAEAGIQAVRQRRALRTSDIGRLTSGI